jgi:hypothetical protein
MMIDRRDFVASATLVFVARPFIISGMQARPTDACAEEIA